jgi:UDP-N-acetylmuramoylalanine--D-glutamate ligase
MTQAEPRRIAVVGMGRSGIGAARLLQARGHDVVILERADRPELRQTAAALKSAGIRVRLDTPLEIGSFEALPASPEAVVVSPGIRWDHPVLQQLRQRGIQVRGELLPAWEATGSIPWIGITGTNGKTTVTHLIHHVLSRAGLDAPLCGNVGVSVAEVALERMAPGARRPDWMVVEISSYQIEAAPEVAPAIGIWTTLTPDHLERHGTLSNYRAIKSHLLRNSRIPILNADDADLRAHADSWGAARWVTAGAREDLAGKIQPSLWIEDGWIRNAERALLRADCLPMPGRHNLQNMMLTVAAGLEVGVDPAAVAEALRSFPGVPHRLERVRTLDGVTWINDSKATNYDAAAVALEALPGPLVVLAGGEAKRGEAGAWLAALERKAAAVVLFGAARETFASLLQDNGYGGVVLKLPELEEAVPAAAALARQTGSGHVLLSPACASFDQYRDFEERGDHFRQLVEAL